MDNIVSISTSADEESEAQKGWPSCSSPGHTVAEPAAFELVAL